ncbi:hypothetical protein [Lysinibacillus sp. TE18511]
MLKSNASATCYFLCGSGQLDQFHIGVIASESFRPTDVFCAKAKRKRKRSESEAKAKRKRSESGKCFLRESEASATDVFCAKARWESSTE